MNTKANIIGFVLETLLLVALIFVCIFAYSYLKQDYTSYKEYKQFCEDNKEFCYCGWGSCTFMLKDSIICKNGECTYDRPDVQDEFCKLAQRLNDSKRLFEGGCYN